VRPAEDRLVDARIEDRGDHPVDKRGPGDGQLVQVSAECFASGGLLTLAWYGVMTGRERRDVPGSTW
jgi:hypothetical protein